MAKVSISIPAYRQVEYLRRTLQSIIEQDFSDYEIILTDDSPDDAVKDLLSEFNFDGRLLYFKNAPALGSPQNWNYSISKASGEYIKILHHDDYFTKPDSLRKFVGLLDSNPGSGFGFSATEVKILAMNKVITHKCSNRDLKKISRNPETLFFGNRIGAPSCTIIRKRFMEEFDPSLKWLVDIDWYIRLIRKSPSIAYTSETLVCTVHGAEGQVTQEVINDREIQLREHLYLFLKLQLPVSLNNKYSLYFQVLFHKFKLNMLEDLRKLAGVPDNHLPYFERLIELKSNNPLFKKIRYWAGQGKMKDLIFMIKEIFR